MIIHQDHKMKRHGHPPGPREATSLLVFIRRRGSFAKARSLSPGEDCWGLLGCWEQGQ